jgi:antagonist of KipI
MTGGALGQATGPATDGKIDVLEVVSAGILTTVQDLGRFGHRTSGVPIAGACDPVALAAANLLAGNDSGAAALEATIVGPELLALADIAIAIAGADLGAVVLPSGRRLPVNATSRLRAGERLSMPGVATVDRRPADGRGLDVGAGARAYIAIADGIAVEPVLGSRSTSLVGGFGGLGGRPLRAGDRIARRDSQSNAAASPAAMARATAWPGDLRLPRSGDPIRVLPAPFSLHAVGRGAFEPGPPELSDALERLTGTRWRVAPASDRRGLRLEGPPIPVLGPADRPSHGVVPGTIQLTPGGQPLVLLRDGGTTGGYPVIAVVISADLAIAGQARPGGEVRFEVTDLETAHRAARERAAMLGQAAARLADAAAHVPADSSDDPWDDLADLAGS